MGSDLGREPRVAELWPRERLESAVDACHSSATAQTMMNSLTSASGAGGSKIMQLPSYGKGRGGGDIGDSCVTTPFQGQMY
jgi:hypothetical protein